MKPLLLKALSVIILSFACTFSFSGEIKIKINKKYLNFPVSHSQNRAKMTFKTEGKPDLKVEIRLAPDKADYWVFKDVSDIKGKILEITYDGDDKGLSKIYQDDKIAGQDSLYKEKNRPQFHFTSRIGWNNDPNGLVYYDGEYHLFYQHNPYERDWGNMHWGHSVSKDLIHWEELPNALYPDKLGDMFSGSAVIDYDNTAGFNKGKTPAMIAAYTAAGPGKQVQCIAYSLDKGRTFTKYEGNPVIDSRDRVKSESTRDPKVFWYEPGKHWVLVLLERSGHSIYTSKNLKEWNYESHVTGFWECPELFELPVDGDKNNTKWVIYGASGTYMIGSFNGKVFTPELGKYYNSSGTIYAAQTFTNIPESDGRRIQIGWGRISHPGMPFNSCMLLPTELQLKTTKNGIRMFSSPVKEIEALQGIPSKWENLSAGEANEKLKEFSDSDCLRIKTTFKMTHATDAGFSWLGQQLIRYDMNQNQINGVFYSPLDDIGSMELTADIFIDKTVIEVFIDGGAYSYSIERRFNENKDGFRFWGHEVEVKNLEVYPMQSIWK